MVNHNLPALTIINYPINHHIYINKIPTDGIPLSLPAYSDFPSSRRRKVSGAQFDTARSSAPVDGGKTNLIHCRFEGFTKIVQDDCVHYLYTSDGKNVCMCMCKCKCMCMCKCKCMCMCMWCVCDVNVYVYVMRLCVCVNVCMGVRVYVCYVMLCFFLCFFMLCYLM